MILQKHVECLTFLLLPSLGIGERESQRERERERESERESQRNGHFCNPKKAL